MTQQQPTGNLYDLFKQDFLFSALYPDIFTNFE